jgi:DNA repair protein RecO (recombination protein O)
MSLNRVNTQGIILSRTDYGEADRILTFLTPDHGKVSVIAKGVRKQNSKLAGGIELFSVSEISYIIGRRDISTLISSRLITHYGNIVKDISRTNTGYEFIKMINKATEDKPDESYFRLLRQLFEALDDHSIDLELIKAWFTAQLLRLGGHTPNLRTQHSGEKLQAGKTYDFNFENMSFQEGEGTGADQIKFLRLLFSENSPKTLQKVSGAPKLAAQSHRLIQPMLQTYIRL